MYNSDKRILNLIEFLISSGEIKTKKDFSKRANMLEQTISKIQKEKAHFTGQQIENICIAFNINANWIFGTETKVFTNKNSVIADNKVTSS